MIGRQFSTCASCIGFGNHGLAAHAIAKSEPIKRFSGNYFTVYVRISKDSLGSLCPLIIYGHIML